jgi:single-stranded DNA-binding protein
MLTQDRWTGRDGEKRSEVVIVVFEAHIPEYAKADAAEASTSSIPEDDVPF